MKLVIAEKPSVAQSLTRVIGADKRQDGYLEGGGYLVSWCVGHLVELSAPERYDERFAKWRLEDLPILPKRWLYEVSQATRKQYQILKSLILNLAYKYLLQADEALAAKAADLLFFGFRLPIYLLLVIRGTNMLAIKLILEGHRRSSRCRPEPLFLEHGISSLSGRQRL